MQFSVQRFALNRALYCKMPSKSKLVDNHLIIRRARHLIQSIAFSTNNN